MSPAALRWMALPLGLLAFALRLLAMWWFTPLTWDMSTSGSMLALAAGYLVTAAIPFGIFLLICSVRHRPARFTAGDGRFTVRPSPALGGSQAILWFFLSAGLVVLERVPGGDSLRLFKDGLTWSLAGVGVAWAVALAFLLVQRPQLHLDPEGMTLRRLWGTKRVQWDQLLPDGPRPPAKRDGFMRVYLRGAPIAGQWPSVDIPFRSLHIDPAFLANALRHYGEHPEDRATIGSAEGAALATSA